MDGDLITTKSSSYLVEDFLGEGTFGKVARCVEVATNEKVAVKIIKNSPGLLASAKQEIRILTRLQALDPERCGIVKWMGDFKHGPYVCLVFELLDQSLLDFTRQRAGRSLPLMQIENIVEQLASALDHLGTLGIIHADLKPDNVMMTGQDTQVKLIDFGCSIHLSQAKIGYDFCTIWYRSPEIMLGLPYTCMVDMWSLGCLAAELLIGAPLYPGYTEYDMWAYIIQTHGELPDAMLNQGIKTSLCFTKGPVWRRKTRREKEEGMRSKGLQRRWPRPFLFTSLEDVVEAGHQPGQPIPPSFTDLLKRMLHLDCDQRITPRALLEHPFFSLGREIQTDSSSPERTMVQPYSSSPERTMVQPYSSSPEPTMDQSYSSSPERTMVQPYSSSPEPTVVQSYSSSPEPTVVQPYSHCPEPTMDQPCSSRPEPTVVQPYSHCPEPTMDQPCSSRPEPTVVQPYSHCPEPTMDQPCSSRPESTVPQPYSHCPEPTMDQPCSSRPESTVAQPYSHCPEPSVAQPCGLPGIPKPSVSEEQKKAPVDTTDSGKG
ncbi:homeodomain-interacting protein kinase 2-like [Gadus chalcogrammus]|uniref:homeodomain-interacting protein kinase 2-like n=1 Tax=Gadus chalcogrammus TaxID=1042646 RepID=UPI0024C3C513|nr:homeodomain-interacting protein kinase 2-like [Gadus chalcogrammus]